MKKCTVGGQGVIEGIMMRSPELSAIAVRKENGKIIYSKKRFTPLVKKNKFFGIPIVRGVVSFVDTLIMGVSTITQSAKMYDETLAENEEPSKFEKFLAEKTNKNAFDIAAYLAVLLALVIGAGLFFILPTTLASLFKPFINSSFVMNLIDGAIRLLILVAYMFAISFMKDIKRVFKYHGAEHKTIHCYEHEEELNIENIQKYSTLHPRCGTSYLFLVMAVAILLFSLLGWSDNVLLRIGIRLLLVPIIAGAAFEVLKFAAKYENVLTKIIRAPGMCLQRLSTKKPDDDMVEVAIVAFLAAMDENSDDELDEICNKFARGKEKERLDLIERSGEVHPNQEDTEQ